MRRLKNILFYTSLTLFGLLSFQLKGQPKSDSLIYDLLINDELIGEMYVAKNVNGDATYNYSCVSNVDYRLLFSFNIQFFYLSNFDADGNYQSSEFKYLFNEDVKEANWINCRGNKCYVYEGAVVKKIIENPLHRTTMEMYFNEPSEDTWLFSERFGANLKVEKEEKDLFKIDFPGGNTCHYYYNKGICSKVIINMLLSDMEFRLRKKYPLYSAK